jgi:hypothetical protein
MSEPQLGVADNLASIASPAHHLRPDDDDDCGLVRQVSWATIPYPPHDTYTCLFKSITIKVTILIIITMPTAAGTAASDNNGTRATAGGWRS